MNALAPYAKSIILLVLIMLALAADALGADIGLDAGHYAALLIGNVAVYAVPNRGRGGA